MEAVGLIGWVVPNDSGIRHVRVRRGATAALLFAFALLLSGCFSSSPGVTIQGRITDSVSGVGIYDATVSVTYLSQVYTGRTDREGRYAITNLPLPREGGVLSWEVVESPANGSHLPGQLQVDVAPGQRSVVVDFPMYTAARGDVFGKLHVGQVGSVAAVTAEAVAGKSLHGGGSLLPSKPFRKIPVAREGEAATGRSSDIVVKLGRGTSEQEAKEIAARHGADIVSSLPELGYWVFRPRVGNRLLSSQDVHESARVELAESVEKLRASLAADSMVMSAEKSRKLYALGYPGDVEPNDEYFMSQWNMQMIQMPQAWSYTQGQPNVVVAVVDSGIKAQHNDLQLNLLPGYNVINPSQSPDDEGEPISNSSDRFSHGTHVAGIIGAVGNNWLGVAGVNWRVSILPVKVLQWEAGSVSGNDYDVAEGIRYAADYGADVINLSLGISDTGGGYTETSAVLRDAIDYAIAKGAVVVAAAGNEGTPYLASPASYPRVISVGAVDRLGQRASYSSYGAWLTVVAPGGDDSQAGGADGLILSTGWDYRLQQSSYVYAAGTSMAAPHVSGLAALLVAMGVHGQDNVRHILEESAIDLGTPGYDNEYGYGLIDAARALELAGTPPSGGGDNDPDILARARVFTAYRFQDRLYPRSDFAAPEKVSGQGYTYHLDSYAGASDWVVAAWIDTNGDERIDVGDYYGEYRYPVSVLPGSPSFDVDITLDYVGGLSSSLRVRGLSLSR